MQSLRLNRPVVKYGSKPLKVSPGGTFEGFWLEKLKALPGKSFKDFWI